MERPDPTSGAQRPMANAKVTQNGGGGLGGEGQPVGEGQACWGRRKVQQLPAGVGQHRGRASMSPLAS